MRNAEYDFEALVFSHCSSATATINIGKRICYASHTAMIPHTPLVHNNLLYSCMNECIHNMATIK